MADPYLEDLERVLPKARDLHHAAELLGLDFETVCLTFNNGLLKGYWRIEITGDKGDPKA